MNQPGNHSMKEAERTAYLIAGYINDSLTEGEQDELNAWVESSDDNLRLFEELTDEQNVKANIDFMQQVAAIDRFQRLRKEGLLGRKRPVRMITWVAAAAVIAAVVISALFLVNNKRPDNFHQSQSSSTFLQPGGNRAVLQVDDGTSVDLTTQLNGSISLGEGSHVSKPADGEIVYDRTDREVPGRMHTLSTPVGGQYRLILPDGTKVWLNAATCLQYRSSFTAQERTVFLDGEAYFEVARDVTRPFRVRLSDSSVITVLGTHFNVSTYSTEATRSVTLLEGKVEVRTGDERRTLVPGHQLTIEKNKLREAGRADVEEAVGWKNGWFVFRDAPIESIMNQLARWYNAKVVYEGEVNPHHFNATIQRGEPLSKVLHLLELTNEIHFRIDNNTIYVLPR